MFNTSFVIYNFLGGLLNSLKLYPFMNKGLLSTNEGVNNAIESGIYHVYGAEVTNVHSYSVLVVFNTLNGYVAQLCLSIGGFAAGYRKYFGGEWSVFKYFTLS